MALKAARKSRPGKPKWAGNRGPMLKSHTAKLSGEDQQPSSVVPAVEEFDEDAYLAANPDVAAAVKNGLYRSGHFHYQTVGWREKRPLFEQGSEPDDRSIRELPKLPVRRKEAIQLQLTVEAALLSDAGGLMIVGWLDDSELPLDYFRVSAAGWQYTFHASAIVRLRRRDVEAVTGSSRTFGFGFLVFAFVAGTLDVSAGCELAVGLKGIGQSATPLALRRVADTELRHTVLCYLAEAEFFGNRQIEVLRALDLSIGGQIIDHNLHITRNIVGGACIERFGRPARPPQGSIVVCLYGKPEYLFLQDAMFAGCPRFEDYELVFVSNSPELAERLLKEAAAAHLVYGIPQTVVLLPGNAGFGAANNAAVCHAQSDRILIVNPDVFPRDPNWALKHSQAVAYLPASQTRIFGVPLYYDDGSLMHGGMYFDVDRGVSLDGNRVLRLQLLRVEHYGKGAPVWADRFTTPRPVPAVTGAFMSMDRAWFENLGGFTENYVFGHYEDADLCLKSIQRGIPPWIHDIRLWHLEGQGSHRLPVHEGGSLVNRWLFNRTWGEVIADGLLGPNPTHRLMQPPQLVSDLAAPTMPPPATRSLSSASMPRRRRMPANGAA